MIAEREPCLLCAFSSTNRLCPDFPDFPTLTDDDLMTNTSRLLFGAAPGDWRWRDPSFLLFNCCKAPWNLSGADTRHSISVSSIIWVLSECTKFSACLWPCSPAHACPQLQVGAFASHIQLWSCCKTLAFIFWQKAGARQPVHFWLPAPTSRRWKRKQLNYFN
jgi:hypothetical protein